MIVKNTVQSKLTDWFKCVVRKEKCEVNKVDQIEKKKAKKQTSLEDWRIQSQTINNDNSCVVVGKSPAEKDDV